MNRIDKFGISGIYYQYCQIDGLQSRLGVDDKDHYLETPLHFPGSIVIDGKRYKDIVVKTSHIIGSDSSRVEVKGKLSRKEWRVLRSDNTPMRQMKVHYDTIDSLIRLYMEAD